MIDPPLQDPDSFRSALYTECTVDICMPLLHINRSHWRTTLLVRHEKGTNRWFHRSTGANRCSRGSFRRDSWSPSSEHHEFDNIAFRSRADERFPMNMFVSIVTKEVGSNCCIAARQFVEVNMHSLGYSFHRKEHCCKWLKCYTESNHTLGFWITETTTDRLGEIALLPTRFWQYHTFSFTIESMLSRTAAVSVSALVAEVML